MNFCYRKDWVNHSDMKLNSVAIRLLENRLYLVEDFVWTDYLHIAWVMQYGKNVWEKQQCQIYLQVYII